MLPRRILASRFRLAWIICLLLAPLAYLGGALLLLKYDPTMQAGLRLDRAQALARAAEFAATKGLNVSGWDSFCIVESNNDLHFYYQLHEGAARDRVRQLAPPIVIKTLFRAPDYQENLEVELAPEGRVLGYRHRLSNSRPAPDAGEAAARQIAEAALRAHPEAAALPPESAPEMEPVINGEITTRIFRWRWPAPELPELKLQFIAAVRGQQLVSDHIEAEVERGFARRVLRRGQGLKAVSTVLYALAALIGVVFGLYRFTRRAQQKELSWQRITIITLIFGAAMALFVLVTDKAVWATALVAGVAPQEYFVYFFAGISFFFMGLFVGLAYGSGEGDIREAYPGKLTSLDALLTGKLFSVNVGRAIVIGAALGGWALLLSFLVVWPWATGRGTGNEIEDLSALVGHAAYLTSLLAWPLDTLLVVVIGLLLPLPFLRRRWRSPRLVAALLALFTWIACAAPYLSFRPWAGQLVSAAVRAALVLLAFFTFDLLTAAVTVAAPSLFSFTLILAAQPAPALRQSGIVTFVCILTLLAAWLVCAWKGRFYREAEVRPVYAKHLAERLSLQAEVSAAREAQQRLLPQKLPLTAHFSVAAACLPAHEVGGDFYDLFELDANRLGVLMAEGGGRGLSAALSIAFAKGFLMPRILSETRTDDAPVEIMRGLQERLTTVLEEGAAVGLAYAVLDTADGTLRYARTGAYPRVLVNRAAQTADGFRTPEEREIKFTSLHGKYGVVIIEGRCELAAGDSVLLFTDGLAKTWAANNRTPEGEFARVLSSEQVGAAAPLQGALLKVVNDCAKQIKRQATSDDLTAVVVRLERETVGQDGILSHKQESQ